MFTNIAHQATQTASTDAPLPHLEIELLPGEAWWGAGTTYGTQMPFTAESDFSANLAVFPLDSTGLGIAANQLAPVLISSKGRCIFSDDPFSFSFCRGLLQVDGNDLHFERSGSTLRDAYLYLTKNVFTPAGKIPAKELFSGPQYNTWIEMPYLPSEDKIYTYVDQIDTCGMPPGVLMIDDNWAATYGTWEFDSRRFPNPKKMCAQLHSRGYSIMLWVVPFISPDTAVARELWTRGYLLKNKTGLPAIRRWWNGFSATLDLSNPEVLEWVKAQLNKLRELGVDGFKFDAGDPRDYFESDQSFRPMSGLEFCETWAALASEFPFNEIRACWKNSGRGIAQRLEDKPPSWDSRGIQALIPNLLAAAMIGHPFTCPDMIGGGEITQMNEASQKGLVDQEFFVRYTQVAALSPMMQFSSSPARLLDSEHLQIVLDTVKLRSYFMDLILELAQHAAETGEPIIRPMSYHCPGLELIKDQFFLGDSVVVAPVTKRGQIARKVWLPKGCWRMYSNNKLHQIDSPFEQVEISSPLECLPVFIKEN